MKLIIDTDAFIDCPQAAVEAKVRQAIAHYKPEAMCHITTKLPTIVAGWAWREKVSDVDIHVLTSPERSHLWEPLRRASQWTSLDLISWCISLWNIPKPKEVAKRLEAHPQGVNLFGLTDVFKRSKTLKDIDAWPIALDIARLFESLWKPVWVDVEYPDDPSHTDRNYHVIDSAEGAQTLISQLLTLSLPIAIDFETDGVEGYPFLEPVGMSICWEPGTAYYIPIAHKHDQNLDFPLAQRIAELVAEKEWIAHNAPFEYHCLLNMGVPFDKITCPRDTMMMLYHDGQSLGLKEASRKILDLPMMTYEEVTKGRPFSEVRVKEAMGYAPVDADHTLRLFNHYHHQLEQERFRNLWLNEALTPVVVRMERKGFRVDVGGIAQWKAELEAEIERLKAQLDTETQSEPGTVNWASGQQVADVFFGRLGLEPQKKGANGYSVDVDTMTFLAGQHPAVDTLLALRGNSKELTTYALPFEEKAWGDRENRIRPRWHRSGTKTNRMSSSKPNGMNIPPAARKYVVAPDGYMLFGADYGQIELRIPAALSGDPALCADFRNGESPHLRTFQAIFGRSDKAAYPAEYTLSKNINFSVLYFSGPQNIIDYAREAGIHLSFSEAKELIDKHKKTYPTLHQWLWSRVELAMKNGYTDTLQGHRAWYPDLFSLDPQRKAAAYREAVNHEIQGTAGGFTKESMLAFDAIWPDTLIFNVHDELDGEAPEAQVKDCLFDLVSTMRSVAEQYIDQIPIEVEGKMGKTWKELK